MSRLDRPIFKGFGLTWEQGLYLLIALLCLVSRLWMLGYRVESHDESLHCKFSWDLYVGNGFQHNPMMHGPFLFHATALSFFLFGDSDFTARLPVALMGTALVLLPYIFRRYLGRTGSLVASFLLLISPAISYYSRYIRHDVPVALWAMLFLWAIFRYLEEGRDRYLYILAAALSLMYATKEVAFIYTAVFGLFLVARLVVRALAEPWEREGLAAAFGIALAVGGVGLLTLGTGWLLARPEGGGPPPVWAVIGGLFGGIGILAALVLFLRGTWHRLPTYRSFHLILLIGTLVLPFASPIPIHLASRLGSLVVERAVDPAAVSPFWSNLANVHPTDYTAPSIYYSGAILGLTILLAILIGLLWDRRRWPIAVTIYLGVFLILFTTVFTNGAGIASGWVGSLGYWLEQQEVQRGGQPWFYYLVIMPLYEFLPLVGAVAASLFLSIGAVVRRLQRKEAQEPDWGRIFIWFTVYWSALSWIGYSYAGEKMPWLSVHLTLPMILLTGWAVGRLIESVDWERVGSQRGWLLALLLPALGAALASLIRAAGRGPFQGVELDQLLVTGTFFGGLVGVAFFGGLVGWLWGRVGGRNGLLLTALTLFAALSLLTVHVAHRLNFVNFDTPAEFLVYAHEGPDVRTTMEQLGELSLRVGGGTRLIDVAYGSDVAWPFTWYLRNYPNAVFYGTQPTADTVRKTAVLAGRDDWAAVEPLLGDDYYRFDYFYLWWPPEDYRQLTWSKLWEWLTDARRRAALWRIFYRMDYTLYDEITDGTHTPDRHWPLRGDFRFYVRKDVVNRLWNFGVGPLPEAETRPVEVETADPYADGMRVLTATLTWGSEGSDPGSFFWPRGIAVSPDGFVYVADAGNHRIQKFTPEGEFVTAWGYEGGCGEAHLPPGTFCEPWGVAVGPDGSVYVADTWAHRVQKFTPDGVFLAGWGTYGEATVGQGPAVFYGPRDVAVGPDGRVYVSDTGNKRVQVFDPEGVFLRDWGGGGSGPGQLDEPVGLAFGPDGRIYVADSWNYRMQVLEPDGTYVREWSIVGWNNPAVEEKPYVAVDAEGRVYATDPGHFRVLVFDAEGNYLYGFGQFGYDASSFALPMGVAIGPDGRLYVTDAANHRVMVFELADQGGD